MVNKVFLVGNLGADPELKTVGEKSLCEIRLATSSAWKGVDGASVTQTEWHNIVVWGAQAEPCAQYLRKGRQVCVVGRIHYEEWENGGEKRYRTRIIADNVTFLGAGPDPEVRTNVSGSGAEPEARSNVRTLPVPIRKRT